MSYINIQNFKYKHMLASLLCVGALVSTCPAEAQHSDLSSEENDVKGVRQSILRDLKDEIKYKKNVKHGVRIQKAGEIFEKADKVISLAAIPVALLSAALSPVGGQIVEGVYLGIKVTVKGTSKVLPLVGDELEKYSYKKLSEKSYIRGNLSDDERNDLIKVVALCQIYKLGIQLDYLNELKGNIRGLRKDSKRKFLNDLIEEKEMKSMAYQTYL